MKVIFDFDMQNNQSKAGVVIQGQDLIFSLVTLYDIENAWLDCFAGKPNKGLCVWCQSKFKYFFPNAVIRSD